jgi:hypothetical protein
VLVDGRNYQTAAVEWSVSVNTVYSIYGASTRSRVCTRKSEAVAKTLAEQDRRVTARLQISLPERFHLFSW